MEKEINSRIGKVVAMIRANKKLTLKEVTGGEFSESMVSLLESGKHSISVDKFFTILVHSKVYLDEFEYLYNDYSQRPDQIFENEVSKAYANKDLTALKKLHTFWSDKAEHSKNKFDKINKIYTQLIIAIVEKSVPFREDVGFLMDYLESVDEWGRYELWIFSNCTSFFDDNALKYYGTLILGKTNFYKRLTNQAMVITTFLNIINAWLTRKNLPQALKYINHVKEIGIPFDCFLEKLFLNYHEAHYHYLQGYDKNKSELKKVIKTLEDYGFQSEADAWTKEIDTF
ncbi:transcriptional regulator [Lactococcus nasutitermitis]|uniref:Transcriptional regulator n=1 Tax=Lactococcus nasutitermitis TaxID=1652957 RepID=A0ABV9JEV0_9LACT|nr:transcriptional regulator [Lactococcus nasutitermitis]